MYVPSAYIQLELLERICEKDPACVQPQPASHLSTVTSRSGCASVIPQASVYFRKRATAIERSTLFLFSGTSCREVPKRAERNEKEKRRVGVGHRDTVSIAPAVCIQ